MKLEAEILDRKNLTKTEIKVLDLMCEAMQNKSIAVVLGVLIRTVERHIDHIYQKLDIRWLSINRRSAAILIAIQSGMIKTVLRSIVAVLVFQCSMLADDDLTRPRIRLPRIVRVRSQVI